MRKTTIRALAAAALMIGLFQNCGGGRFTSQQTGTQTQNSVSAGADGGSDTLKGPGGSQLSGGSGGTTIDNPKPTLDLYVAADIATVSVSDVVMCVTQTNVMGGSYDNAANFLSLLQKYDPSFANDPSLKYFLQASQPQSSLVHLSASGSFIQEFLNTQPYVAQVSLQLSTACNGASFQFTNANGTFALTAGITLKFNGHPAPGTGDLRLDMTAILDALKDVASSPVAAQVLSTTPGTFSHIR